MTTHLKNGKTVGALAAAALLVAPLAAQTGKPATKPSIRGLVTMGKLPFVTDPSAQPDNNFNEANAHPGIYAGVVILATWSKLEPAPGTFDFSQIDAGIKNIRAYNAKYPKTPIVGKLRVFGGVNAPRWAMELDGGPLEIEGQRGKLKIGNFWSKPYRDAWKTLQDALAAKYDADPLMQEVAISSCSSTTAEPFVLPLNEANLAPLTKAGYTDAKIKACLMEAPGDYVSWKRVALDYTVNPYRSLTPEGKIVNQFDWTIEVIDAFRKKYGARAVLANHGLQPTMKPAVVNIIAAIQKLGPPIEFQTISPGVDWTVSAEEAQEYRTSEFEIWDTKDAGGPARISTEQLRTWKQIFAPQP